MQINPQAVGNDLQAAGNQAQPTLTPTERRHWAKPEAKSAEVAQATLNPGFGNSDGDATGS
jgi:hypothetical protein